MAKTIGDHVNGPIIIREDTELTGSIDGDAIVTTGFRLIVHGIVSSSVTVDLGAEAQIYGRVDGRLSNQGGKVTIYGTVHQLRDADGATVIAKGAVVRSVMPITSNKM